jgi:hypothetical protein
MLVGARLCLRKLFPRPYHQVHQGAPLGASEAIPFVALRRDLVSVIEPTTSDEQVEPLGGAGRTKPHDVACLFPSGVLRGTLEVLVNVRVSDFLRQQASLLVLRRCVFAPHNEPLDSPKARKLPVAVVNMAATFGVAEWENARVG